MSAVHSSTLPRWGLLQAYYQLTKPNIVMLMLVTGLPAILLAGNGSPPLATSLLALSGTAMAAGAAGALNHYFDRDVDGLMERTRARPIPRGLVGEQQALVFGLGLAAFSFGWLGFGTNWLAAGIALASILCYVVVYTLWLKRRTPQNIVIGGAAGATAPLIGWAAIQGDLSLTPILMALIIFLWTPPHFWSLALFRREDYARASLPMLPVTAGPDATRQHILFYSLGMVTSSLLLISNHGIGLLYLGGAVLLGAWFIEGSFRLNREKTDEAAHTLFLRSITYLLLLFAVLTFDVLIGIKADASPREITVHFRADVDRLAPVDFRPLAPAKRVKLGAFETIQYRATNLTASALELQALHHVRPAAAEPYFIKQACFCSTIQTLMPHQTRDLSLQFKIQPGLSPKTSEIVLGYTAYRVNSRKGAKPGAVSRTSGP